jgi:putative transposase
MTVCSGEWFTAAEVAKLALPTLPGTKQGILDRALRESWTKRSRQARGGGNEFHVSSLPIVAREALIEKQRAEALAKLMPLPSAEEIEFIVVHRPGN